MVRSLLSDLFADPLRPRRREAAIDGGRGLSASRDSGGSAPRRTPDPRETRRAPEEDRRSSPAPAPAQPLLASLNLTPVGSAGEQFQTEISTTVRLGDRLFALSSGGGETLQVSDLSQSADPTLLQRLPLGAYTSQSVASFGNLIAVALSPVDYNTSPARGLVRFYRLEADGTLVFLQDVGVGFLPDGLAFSADGRTLVVANEGQPDWGAAGALVGGQPSYPEAYTVDPQGTISLIQITGLGARGLTASSQLRFTHTELDFDGIALPPGVRIGGRTGVTLSQGQDIEPEFVDVLGRYAYVTLQENNAVAKVDLQNRRIVAVFDLGSVDFSGQLVDLSDRDGGFRPVFGQAFQGLRMADGIDAFRIRGKDYFITANEGDARVYADNDNAVYSDEERNDLAPNKRLKTIDPTGNPAAKVNGSLAFGGRSLSIFDAENGKLIWDSGNSLQTIAVAAGTYDDSRSDDKGVEPETVLVVEFGERSYAIAAMERGLQTTLAVFDVSRPAAARYVSHIVIPGSISPEGLKLIPAASSPTGRAQLLVSNELSNTLDTIDLDALIHTPGPGSAGSFQPTMLRDVDGGSSLAISSLLTTGEFTSGTRPGSPTYAPVGIFDGMGAYANKGGDTFTLLVNHELGATSGYGYQLAGVAGVFTGARISSFVIDKDIDDNAANGYQSRVISGGLAYDRIILAGSEAPIDDVADLGGAAGFSRFCSANLVEAESFAGERGFEDRIYLLGEEEFSGAGGSFFALDVDGRSLYQVKGFGKGTWESATIVDTGSEDTVAVLLFDDAKAPLYLWVGRKTEGGFLERNGLAEANGSLYAFVPGGLAETGADASPGPDADDLNAVALNTAIGGSWVNLEALNPDYASLGAPALRELAVGAGALQLSRIEDGEVNPLNSQQVVFVTTGTKDFGSADLYGNVYTLDFGQTFVDGQLASGGSSSLKVVYDADRLADPTTGIRNPDNLTISADGFVYLQEDRANGGGTDVSQGNFGTAEASIWKLGIDPITGNAIGAPERWAQIDRTAVPTAYGQTDANPVTSPVDPDIGTWESSGIIDVSTIYGQAAGSTFLANVQAHSLKDGNLWGAGYLVEGGQIDLIQQAPPVL